MAKTSRLRVDLYANVQHFEAAIGRATLTMQKFGINANKLGAQVRTGIAVGATAAVTALGALVVSSMKAQEELGLAAKALGFSNKEFAARSLVAKEAGVEQEKFTLAIKNSQKAIAEASQGTKSANDALAQLGISIKDIEGLSPAQQFDEIAQALGKMEAGAERTALAQDLFGKSGLAMLNVMDGYKGSVESATAYQEKFNLVLSEVETAQIDAAGDTFDRVKNTVGGLGNIMASKLAPVIDEIGKSFLESGYDAQGAGDMMTAAMMGVAATLDTIREGIIGIRVAYNETERFIANSSAFLEKITLSGQVASRVSAFGKKNDYITQWPEQVEARSQDLRDAIENFEYNTDWLARIQKEADEKAKAYADKKKDQPRILDDGADGVDSSYDTPTTPQRSYGSGRSVSPQSQRIDAAQKQALAFSDILDQIDAKSKDLQIQIDTVGLTDAEREAALFIEDINAKIRDAGVVLTEAQKAQLDSLVAQIDATSVALGEMEAKVERNKQMWDGFGQASGNAVDSLIDNLMRGEKGFASFRDVALDMLNDVLNSMMSTMNGGQSIGGSLGNALGGALASAFGGGGGMNFGVGDITWNPIPSHATGSAYITRDTMARLHKGEAVIPASEVRAGGGGVNVTVINNTQGQISVKENNSGGMRGVEVMVDDMMASNITNPTSRSNKAINRMSNGSLIRR